MSQKKSPTKRRTSGVNVRDMEAKKNPGGGHKSGRHHRPIHSSKDSDQTSPILLP